MAKERLSKLQKWIITECFKVNVLLDRSDLKTPRDLCRYLKPECKEKITKYRSSYNSVWNRCLDKCKDCKGYLLYKEDILLSYFNLEISTDIPWHTWSLWYKKEHFKTTKESKKAYVTLTRSLKNLWEKDLAYEWMDNTNIISLTAKGKELAIELLGLDKNILSTIEPPIKSEEQCIKEREETEKQLLTIRNQSDFQ